MKLSELLSNLDSSPISNNPQSAMIVGFLNSELNLVGDAALTKNSSGAEAIAVIYKAEQSTQDKIFLKDFTPVRQKDSYKFTIVVLTVLAVLAGIGYQDSPEIVKLLLSGIIEIAKTQAVTP
jgi:hypothetical protein